MAIFVSNLTLLSNPSSHLSSSIICTPTHKLQFSPRSIYKIITPNRQILPERLNVCVGESRARKLILSARKKRRGIGSQRTRRFVLESIPIIASRLNLLPEPLNKIIREFGGGSGGGGSGFLKGFGGGGFDGWRRRRKWKFGFFGVLIGFCLMVLLCREFEIDLIWGILGFVMFEVLIQFCKFGFRDWILGIFCCVGLGTMKGKVEKVVEKYRVCCSPLMEVVRRRRKNFKRGAW